MKCEGMWVFWCNARLVDAPVGSDGVKSISEVATLDDSALCPGCSSGMRQVGPLRIPAAGLARSKRVAEFLPSVGFWPSVMIDESVVESIGPSLAGDVELRKVELTGRGKRTMDWYQMIPSGRLPSDGLVHRLMRIIRCGQCGSSWTRYRDPATEAAQTLTETWYHTDALDAAWPKSGVALRPWMTVDAMRDGRPTLRRSPKDGRIISFPGAGLVLDDRAAELFRSLKDRRLEFRASSRPLSAVPAAERAALIELYERDRLDK